MPKKNKTEKKETWWLIDYDLPKGSAGRVQFYKDLKKLKVTKSSQSVILTNSFIKAKTVHRKAAAMGRSSLYKVKKKKPKA